MAGKQELLVEQIANSTFTVMASRYAAVSAASLDCLSSRELREQCFAAIFDPDIGEYTLIIQPLALAGIVLRPECEAHDGYRVIRFNLFAPFEGVGFIATLAGAIARKGINILCVSAYSCDYILVKDGDVQDAVCALRELGMREKSAPSEDSS